MILIPVPRLPPRSQAKSLRLLRQHLLERQDMQPPKLSLRVYDHCTSYSLARGSCYSTEYRKSRRSRKCCTRLLASNRRVDRTAGNRGPSAFSFDQSMRWASAIVNSPRRCATSGESPLARRPRTHAPCCVASRIGDDHFSKMRLA